MQERNRSAAQEKDMIRVGVRSIATIKALLGRDRIDVSLPSGATIEDVLARLVELGGPQLTSYFAEPKEKSAHAPLRVMVNGRDITVLQGRQTVLADGDDILVFVPIAGG
jgi:molybdopterin synthase sulfur carrier subunit